MRKVISYGTDAKAGLPTLRLTPDVDRGEVEALVSVFNNVDLQGDVVRPGAFKNSIARWAVKGDPVPVLWAHDWSDPLSHIGAVMEMSETPAGLLVRYKLDIADNPRARTVFKLLKERRVTEHSFAYDVIRERPGADGANELLELDLIEVGPVLKGANPLTQLLGVKSASARGLDPAPAQDPDLRREAARFLLRALIYPSDNHDLSVHELDQAAAAARIAGESRWEETLKRIADREFFVEHAVRRFGMTAPEARRQWRETETLRMRRVSSAESPRTRGVSSPSRFLAEAEARPRRQATEAARREFEVLAASKRAEEERRKAAERRLAEYHQANFDAPLTRVEVSPRMTLVRSDDDAREQDARRREEAERERVAAEREAERAAEDAAEAELRAHGYADTYYGRS